MKVACFRQNYQSANSLRNIVNKHFFHAVVQGKFFGFSRRRPGFEPKSCGIFGGQRGPGAGFLRVFRFPLPFIPAIVPKSALSIIQGW
jgi:hypothetical protein